jgi:hypothetical protein
MTMRVRRSGTHHLVPQSEHVDEEERIVVPCLTLDTWVDRMGVDLSDVGFIKSDTQGWDARVLAGAARVLAARHIAWQIEFSPPMLERSGTSAEDLFRLLERHFTHFIDLRREEGARIRGTHELHTSLGHVGSARRRYTNLLLYNAST